MSEFRNGLSFYLSCRSRIKSGMTDPASSILHACGLLKGKKATTHWFSLEHLRKLEGVEVVEKRIVKDGNIWTSSGMSAGIDLALAFIEHEAGEGTAGSVQSFAEYYPSGKNYGTFHQDSKAPGYLRAK